MQTDPTITRKLILINLVIITDCNQLKIIALMDSCAVSNLS